MGVLFDCPKLVRRSPETLERNIAQNGISRRTRGNRLERVTREGGKELRFDSEPEASLWKRVMVRVLSWLPIDGLL